MKAEGELGYEPSLLVEMARERRANESVPATANKGKKNVVGQLWDHVAYVLKDRSTRIEGARFVDPTFDDFAPVFDFLNLGGDHVGVSTLNNSQELFAKDSDKNYFERRKRIEVLKEELMGEMLISYPGRSAEEVKAKTALLKEIFGTTSWVALDEYTPERLRQGLDELKAKLAAPANGAKTNTKEAAKA